MLICFPVLQQRIAGSTAPLQQPGGDDETAIPVTIRH